MDMEKYKENLLTGEYRIEMRNKSYVVIDPAGTVCSVTNAMDKAVQRVEELREFYRKLSFKEKSRD